MLWPFEKQYFVAISLFVNVDKARYGFVDWKHRQSIVLVFRPTVLDHNVFALDITSFTEALSKCGQIWLCAASRSDTKKANHGYRRLLRMRGERPGDCRNDKTSE